MELPIKATHNIKLSPNENWDGYQYDNEITMFVKLFREHESNVNKLFILMDYKDDNSQISIIMDLKLY